MNKIMLVLLAVCAGAFGFGGLHEAAIQTQMANDARIGEWQAGTNRLAKTKETAAALRREVMEKKNRLYGAMRYPNISPELLKLLEGDASKGHGAAWAELRQQLGIGWNSSPDYVLVGKQVLKQLDYKKFYSAATVTDTACNLLALSPEEQSALESALKRTREQAQMQIERTEPRGDIVAQYTISAPDPVSNQNLSNYFAVEIAGAVGAERASLLLPGAWPEIRGELEANYDQAETMTIRQTMVNGEPDLVCEMQRGNNVSTSPVRYAHYPSSWFLATFPGGWQDLARREGFELPPRFHN